MTATMKLFALTFVLLLTVHLGELFSVSESIGKWAEKIESGLGISSKQKRSVLPVLDDPDSQESSSEATGQDWSRSNPWFRSRATTRQPSTGFDAIATQQDIQRASFGPFKAIRDECPASCQLELDELRSNLTDLYTAYIILQSELAHLSRHVQFHERALKHIAIQGHMQAANRHAGGGHSQTHSHNHSHHAHEHEGQQHVHEADHHEHNTADSGVTQSSNSYHDEFHRRSSFNHDHNHDRPSTDEPTRRPLFDTDSRYVTPAPPYSAVRGQFGSTSQTLDIDDSVQSNQRPSVYRPTYSPSLVTRPYGYDYNFHHDHSGGSHSASGSASRHRSKHGYSASEVHERTYHSSGEGEQKFQEMDQEFQNWFNKEIRGHHDEDDTRMPPRMPVGSVNQMDKGNEEMTYATCDVTWNTHVALLLQQNVRGRINIWQRRNGAGPVHMHVKLSGFKVHEHGHKQHRQGSRNTRESTLIPMEQEPVNGNGDLFISPTSNQRIFSHTHGFHVHTSGNLTRGCQSTGPHYNPDEMVHGGPMDAIRHVGDLGNIRCDENGKVDAELTFTKVSLSGPQSILGRSLVIHSQSDDYGRNPSSPSSLTTGNSGVRIACCVIEEVARLPTLEDSQSIMQPVASPYLVQKITGN